jgi:two-component system response regulator MprA
VKRVLLVDDDDDLRDALGDVIAHAGYDVALAADGLEALAWLRLSGPPALIVLDLMMPAMSGAEVKALLDGDPALAHVPVLVLSGDTRVAEQAAAMGAAGWLGKPVEITTLLATIALNV